MSLNVMLFFLFAIVKYRLSKNQYIKKKKKKQWNFIK